MAPLSLPIAMNGDTGLERQLADKRCRVVRHHLILHQELRPVEGIAHADGRNLCVNASLPEDLRGLSFRKIVHRGTSKLFAAELLRARGRLRRGGMTGGSKQPSVPSDGREDPLICHRPDRWHCQALALPKILWWVRKCWVAPLSNTRLTTSVSPRSGSQTASCGCPAPNGTARKLFLEQFRSAPRTCRCFRGSLTLR